MTYIHKKNILFIENGIGYGGAAICLKYLLSKLDKDRFRPFVLTDKRDANYRSFNDISEWYCVRDKYFEKKGVFNFLKSLQNLFIIKKVVSILDYLINVLPYTIKLLFFIKKNNIALVHINNDPITNMSGILAARISNIPCICHLRGTLWDSWTTRRLLRWITFFIPVSNYIKEELKKYNIGENKMQVINGGIDIDKFTCDSVNGVIRKEFSIREGAPLVGILGVLIQWKGQKTVIEAMPSILNRFPDCKLLIVGEAPCGYEYYKRELITLVKNKCLNNSVIFTGHRTDVIEVICELDILLHASNLPEPFGRVIIEGMALGKPVIATALGGPTEIIKNNITGILIPPDNPEILATEVCRLLMDKELQLNFGKNAREVAINKYSSSSLTRLMEAVYLDILG